jgi:mannose-6-phosphate isomerase-like protein (cupin superfamily)
MAAEFIDIVKGPQLEKGHGKKILFNSRGFHTWIHGDYAGDKGVMHKHSADQTFYCIEGECTFHFPDGTSRKLSPGMIVHIEAGTLYQLENTGEGYMALLGNRAENGKNVRFLESGEAVAINRSAEQVAAMEKAKAAAKA